jgi:Tfp pilus assembly protein PilO
VISLTCVLGMYIVQRRLSAELQAAQSRLGELQASADQAKPAAQPPSADDTDFALRLPADANAQSLVKIIRRAADASGVTIIGLTNTDRQPTQRALGRIEVSVNLRGSYPAVRQVLAETLQSQPAPVLQRLSMRRDSPASGVQATLDLALYKRPLASNPQSP